MSKKRPDDYDRVILNGVPVRSSSVTFTVDGRPLSDVFRDVKVVEVLGLEEQDKILYAFNGQRPPPKGWESTPSDPIAAIREMFDRLPTRPPPALSSLPGLWDWARAYDTLHALLKRIDVSGFPAKLRFELTGDVRRMDFREVLLCCELAVRDRETREATELRDHCSFSVHVVNDLAAGGETSRKLLAKVVVEAVRKTLQKMLVHELDECLLVDGERVFDPHRT